MKGIYNKYSVEHADGSPVDGQCFVLKLSDPAARRALMTYAIAVQETNPQLSTDIALMIRNHNQNSEIPKPAPRFCWSDDGEGYNADNASRWEAIQEAQAQLGEIDEVWVGELVPGRDLVKPQSIGDYLNEHIRDVLFEETGDQCDGFEMSEAQQTTLGQVVIDWIDINVGFGCQAVKNTRYYTAPFDPANEGFEVIE